MGWVKSKKIFPETIIYKIFETNSCKIAHYRKSLVYVFKRFLLLLRKYSFLQEDWALGYHSMKFRILWRCFCIKKAKTSFHLQIKYCVINSLSLNQITIKKKIEYFLWVYWSFKLCSIYSNELIILVVIDFRSFKNESSAAVCTWQFFGIIHMKNFMINFFFQIV